MDEAHIAAPLVRRVVEDVVARGVDRSALLAEAGVPARALAPTVLRVPFSVVEDLFEAGERLTGDERIGLHLGCTPDLEAAGLPLVLIAASGTLRVATQRLARFVHLWSSAYAIEADWDPAVLRVVIRRPERRAIEHIRELQAAHAAYFMSQIFGMDEDFREVRFPHPREGDVGPWEDVLRCRVRFGVGEHLEFHVASGVLDRPFPSASRLILEMFEDRARQALGALPAAGGVATRVRALLRADLDHGRLGDASVEEVAERLRLAPRTLQRSLARERTSFSAELEVVRREAAERLLRQGADIAEVSWWLGYSEPAVFHRAFKRWTGETPERWRKGTP